MKESPLLSEIFTNSAVFPFNQNLLHTPLPQQYSILYSIKLDDQYISYMLAVRLRFQATWATAAERSTFFPSEPLF